MNPTNEDRVVVADIGGTNCRLGLARRTGLRPELEHLCEMPTPSGGIEGTILDYLASAQLVRPAGIAIAAAGRVRRLASRTWVTLTNAPLSIERESLVALGGGRAFLLNDLAAVAAALPLLMPSDLRAFGPALTAVPGLRLVVGIGTGFGASALSLAGETLDTEAGHADLPAVSAEEHAWCARMAPEGRVEIEHVLSGSGLLRLHEAITGERCPTVPLLIERWRAQDPGAIETLAAFSTWFGRVVGNLVLSLGAWGGVYLIGGVVSGLGAALDPIAFRRGMEDKAPFAPDLAGVPVHHIVHPQPAMLGLAGLALRD